MKATQHILRDFIMRQNLKDINLDDHFEARGSSLSERGFPFVDNLESVNSDENNNATSEGDAADNPKLNSTFLASNSKKHGIKYGIAVSGGGFRSTFVGAGMIQGFDSRTPHKSSLAGILDAATHFSALSGGGWLLSTLYNNDFKNVRKLLEDGKLWNFKDSFLLPENGNNFFLNDLAFYTSVSRQIMEKYLAGFPVTVTDIYSHLIAPIFFERSNTQCKQGRVDTGRLWSDIENYSYYKNAEAPFPILLSTARLHGGEDEHPNDTVIEITPQEFGSYDATLHAFAKLKYLGTSMNNNQVQSRAGQSKQCVSGYDSITFITGTTASIFDKVIWTLLESNNILVNALGSVLNVLLEPESLDMALYEPNPFLNYKNPTYDIVYNNMTVARNLQLSDGAFAGENVPLWPLLYKPRDLDAVFISDMSGDTNKRYAAGRSLIHTYNRASGAVRNAEEGFNDKKKYPQKHFMMPVPDENSFVNLGLTTKPTFFGCNAKQFMTPTQITNKDFSTVPPLLIYIANTPISSYANLDNFQMAVSREEITDMIQNGFDVVNQADEPDWPKCVACALLQRDRERQGQWNPTAECRECFDKYCWNGKYDSRDMNVAKLHNNPQPKKFSK